MLLVALLAFVTGCKPNSAAAQGSEGLPPVSLEEVASGLQSPTTIVNANDGSDRLFVLEQPGRIRVIEGGEMLREPFLDLSGEISSGGERGLLGLAFHPDFAETGEFFVNYTDTAGDTVIARYQVSNDLNKADRGSAQPLLRIEQPYANHNGGGLAFGPDGYLYASSGDGGAGGDPHDNGQNLGTLLGTILRIDVDSGDPYAVPEDNPFVDEAEARPEIWAYGLRNPWRFSFDPETGDMWIADVGQNMWEEINHQPAGRAGENYGWRVMEGAHCFEPSQGCDTAGFSMPLLEYDHDQGCSVTGGYRYRGNGIEALDGSYLFGDYCSGTIWAARETADGDWESEELLETGFRISAFGVDEAEEVYVADHGGGTIYRLVPGR